MMNKIILNILKSAISIEESIKTGAALGLSRESPSKASSESAEGSWSSVPVRNVEIRSVFTAHSAKEISI